MEPSRPEIVVCADRCRELYQPLIGWKGQLAIVSYGLVYTGLAFVTRIQWLPVVGVATIGAFVVIPIVIKSHRFFTALPCPQCREPVGKYETRKSRIHLCCQHCGHVAPTDCRIYYNGGIPEKG
jgi:hypothetical protein